MPGLQQALRTRPPGEVVALVEAAAKLLSASLEASFGLCCLSQPQQMPTEPSVVLKNCLSFLLWVRCCVFLHKPVLFNSQTCEL